MFSCLCCCTKKDNKTESKYKKRFSTGELIFEDVQNLRNIVHNNQQKIESKIVNGVHTK